MATHTFLGDYPSNHNAGWTDKLQGVTHDSEHWYFTQEKKLWKFHVRKDLGVDPLKADASADMPDELKNLGCNHFGDPDYFELDGQGYLFVPVEGGNDCQRVPIVAVFRVERSTLPFVGYDALEMPIANVDKSKIGWCAINPVSGLLYTSHNEIGQGFPIFRYDIDHEALRNSKVKLTRESIILQLWETNARKKRVHIPKYVQGGAFSPDGVLYISSGRLTKLPKLFNEEDDGGIFVFRIDDDLAEGILQDRSSLDDMPFKYHYHSGFWQYEEPEGLTYWDIDELKQNSQFTIPQGIEGQLHAILLDKPYPFPIFTDDEIFFKHYGIG